MTKVTTAGVRGRKRKQETRAAEFRRRLLAWKETSEALRPSLRALARELGTSHQLMTHYLAGLEKWLYTERYRQAKKQAEEICARAETESRELTPWEEEQVRACERAHLQALAVPPMLALLERIKREAKSGPLDRCQFKTLQLFARANYPGAQELLHKYSLQGLKQRKRFRDVIRETPRQEGEAFVSWIRRIWDECEKYDTTDRPAVITEELLERYSRAGRQKRRNNLPVRAGGVAKSFRTE